MLPSVVSSIRRGSALVFGVECSDDSHLVNGRPKRSPREKDLTSRYLSGSMDEDRVEQQQRFTDRNKQAQQNRIEKTTQQREDAGGAADIEALAIGDVIQVHSLFTQVEHAGRVVRCVTRKTLMTVSTTAVVVGDQVRFRDQGTSDESGHPQGVIEAVLPRRTVLTRSDSFSGMGEHPIVANADRMLIVASLSHPRIKWGLIDRMLIGAQSGGLQPIICLNKIDLAGEDAASISTLEAAREAMRHYQSLGALGVETSVETRLGIDSLKQLLIGRTTVLAGHSGVGKSSLIRAVQPSLDLRIGRVSAYNQKGRHTTSSARRFALEGGGYVIDTPGVKMFGLWGVTADNLDDFFPDLADGTAPAWRRASRERIAASLVTVRGGGD